jgi:AcrR family transcriptional regulator
VIGERWTTGCRTNYYPDRPAGVRGARRDSTRGRIVDAAAELFGEYGYSAASISHIAQVAKVHVATLYDHFDSKRHLALVLFDRQAEAHLDAAAAAPSSDPLDDLRCHLRTIAGFVSFTAELARLYLAAIACGDHAPHADDVIRRSTVALVERLPIDEHGGPDATERLADDLLITTIGTMLRHPGDGAEEAAESAIRVLRATLVGARDVGLGRRDRG